MNAVPKAHVKQQTYVYCNYITIVSHTGSKIAKFEAARSKMGRKENGTQKRQTYGTQQLFSINSINLCRYQHKTNSLKYRKITQKSFAL